MVYTQRATWQIDAERQLTLTPEGTIRAYLRVTAEPGSHLQFDWPAGPLGERRATFGGRVVSVEHATAAQEFAFDSLVD
jgi:hypothetical protein